MASSKKPPKAGEVAQAVASANAPPPPPPPPAGDLYDVISPLHYGIEPKWYEIGDEVRMPPEHAKGLLGHTITKRA